MYKSLALAALLLPFSVYTITKEERMNEIDELARELIWDGMRDWMYLLCTQRCIDLSMMSKEDQELFWKKMENLKNKMSELDAEYKELEQSCKDQ